MEIKALIDKAAEKVSTKTNLARLLEVSPQRVTDWGQGYRPCPMEVQVALCEVAELSDRECRAHLREAAGVVPKLMRTLMACVLGVGLSTAAVFAPRAEAAGTDRLSTMYTWWTRLIALRQRPTISVL